MDASEIPGTDEERQLAFIGFATVLGVGVVAYELARAVRDGDLLATDPMPEKPKAGALALAGGFALFGVSANEAAKEIGWMPLILGTTGVGLAAIVLRGVRG